MKAAISRYRAGKRVSTSALGHRATTHMIAARYGTTAELVREWPADDYADAVSFLALTGD